MLNEVSEYLFPDIFDYENDTVTIILNPPLGFIKISQQKMIISPVLFNTVGIHNLNVRLQDPWPLYTEYNMTLEVANTLPRFVNNQPSDQTMYLNEVLFYNLPALIDKEKHEIYLIPTAMPSFASTHGLQFIFKPINLDDVGVKNVLFMITDNVTQGVSDSYSFKVTVVNSPPFFKSPLENLKVVQGSVRDYTFPQISDRENL